MQFIELLENCLSFFQYVECSPGIFPICLSGLRQSDSPTHSLEQCSTKFGFQVLDLLRQCGLRYQQFLGSVSEMAVLGNRQKVGSARNEVRVVTCV